MCGIIGITSNKLVSSPIINSLKKLEYRGYDSAGIATIDSGFIKEVKCEGRVKFRGSCFKIKANRKCWNWTCKMGNSWNSKHY